MFFENSSLHAYEIIFMCIKGLYDIAQMVSLQMGI